MAATVLTATELAAELETTPREVRKFLRSITPRDDQPGKGSRWTIEKKRLRTLRKQHADWTAAQEAKRAEREAAAETDETTPDENETTD